MHPALIAMLQEFDSEAKKTALLLNLIPEDKLSWRPHEKSSTLGQLALHVATIPGNVSNMIEGDSVDTAEREFDAAQPEDRQQIIDALEPSLVQMKERLSSYDETKLFAEWSFTKAGNALFSAPRIGIIRSIIGNHLYHHRGQLTVYLRILNIALPSIYGPSADENPFA